MKKNTLLLVFLLVAYCLNAWVKTGNVFIAAKSEHDKIKSEPT